MSEGYDEANTLADAEAKVLTERASADEGGSAVAFHGALDVGRGEAGGREGLVIRCPAVPPPVRGNTHRRVEHCFPVLPDAQPLLRRRRRDLPSQIRRYRPRLNCITWSYADQLQPGSRGEMLNLVTS
jgi:hypothetical protein